MTYPRYLMMFVLLVSLPLTAGTESEESNTENNEIEVTGRLVDALTGKPIGGIGFDVRDYRKSYETGVFSEDGKFRFSILPGSYKLGIRSANAGSRARAEVLIRTSDQRQMGFEAGDIDLDLGTVRVVTASDLCTYPFDAATLRALFGANRTTYLVRRENGPWELEGAFTGIGYDISQSWKRNWNPIVCVHETSKKVGTYIGGTPADAIAVIWKVRVARVHDGKVFDETLVADPPKTVTDRTEGIKKTYGRTKGDPKPRFLEWLTSLPNTE